MKASASTLPLQPTPHHTIPTEHSETHNLRPDRVSNESSTKSEDYANNEVVQRVAEAFDDTETVPDVRPCSHSDDEAFDDQDFFEDEPSLGMMESEVWEFGMMERGWWKWGLEGKKDSILRKLEQIALAEHYVRSAFSKL